MPSSKSATQQLLSAVSKSVEMLGESKTAEILNQATVSNEREKHIQFIIKMVCDRLKYSPDLITERNKNNKRIMVLYFICHYCYLLFNPNSVNGRRKSSDGMGQIALVLKRNHTIISAYNKKMVNKRKDKTDKYYQDNFKFFDEEIKKYKSKNIK